MFADESKRLQLLREIERLSNPVVMKQAKQMLLHYKQKSPHIFQDVCVYSDICKMVSENSFRLGPRRFIQDLFAEVNFNTFYVQNAEILSRSTRRVIVRRDTEKVQKAAVESRALSISGMKDRKEELNNNNKNIVYQSNKSVVRGFKVESSNVVEETGEERVSSTKFEPRSPPLTSVKEENTSSTENLQTKNKEDSNCKTDTTKATLPTTIKTLDSLNLTCNENKFPIKSRKETNVIK